jgi:SAM-dependent methyltransferase
MAEVCDLCRANALEPVYWPERSGRDTVVHLCRQCGLVQSLPRGGRNEPVDAAIAPIPNRRNNRTAACMKLLRAHADLNAPLAALDVGTDGDAFARAFADAAPNASVTAFAPEVSLARESFDIVHCRHIENIASPAALLAQLWRTLKPAGLLIVDAPNITMTCSDDIVDEWFDDLRRYHFSPVTLGRVLDAAGFDIIDGPNPMDRANLTFAAVKRAVARRPVPRDLGEAERASALITTYSNARARNLIALTAVAAELRHLAPRRVAMWGAGRLFDNLVTHGGFDPSSLTALIDGVLTPSTGERHGVPLVTPDALKTLPPGIVVVMSRTFAREISRMARQHAPKAEIILYGDLLAQARMALAA